MKRYLEDSLLFDRKINALLSSLLSLYLFANFLNIFLDGDLAWSLYAAVVIGLVFLPAVARRNRSAFPPFEVLLFLSVPFTLKGVEAGFVASRTLNYLTAAGVSLLIITEFDTYTSFRSTPGFSAFLVTITTVAVAGIWAVVRWLSDVYLGTTFLVSENLLMWEFAAAVLAGIIAGQVFAAYFRRKDRRLRNYED